MFDIFAGIARPPTTDFEVWRDEPIQGMLVGVAAALAFVASPLERLCETGQSVWDVATLYGDMSRVLSAGDRDMWWVTNNVGIWSVGFFINKAHSNVAAALDVLVSEWLVRRLGISREPKEQSDRWYRKPIKDRLQELVKHVDEPCAAALGKCLRSLGKYTNSDDADRAVNDVADRAAQPPVALLEIFKSLGSLPYTHEDCLAVCWGRNNAFKHRVGGFRERRVGSQYAADWAIAASAGLEVNSLWSRMVVSL